MLDTAYKSEHKPCSVTLLISKTFAMYLDVSEGKTEDRILIDL